MKKVLIIGVSGFAAVHFRDLQRQVAYGNLVIVGATVINQEEEAEKCTWLRDHGCELFRDYEEMLLRWSGRADICVIPTGIHWHRPMTEAALRAGMNVLLEKPAASTIQDVLHMKQLEQQRQRRVYIAFQHMYSQQLWGVKADILAGNIGPIRLLKSYGIWPRSTGYFNRNDWAGRLHNRGAWILDSPYNNAFAHWLNLLCFLSGPSLSESAAPSEIQAELYCANEIESPDTACMRIRTEGGATLLLYLTHASACSQDPCLEIQGEHGRIVVQEFAPDQPQDGVDYCVIKKENISELRDQMYQIVLEGVDIPGCTLDHACQHTICANGAHESSLIHRIPAKFLTQAPASDGYYLEIEGIDQIIRRAYDQERLFSEMNVNWAKPGRKISLAGYSTFAGLRVAEPLPRPDSIAAS